MIVAKNDKNRPKLEYQFKKKKFEKLSLVNITYFQKLSKKCAAN